jgi:Immunity protein 53
MHQVRETKTTLRRLQDWYARQCDGDWGHQFGVSIVSTDNPGWHVKIDLKGTKWEGVTFDEIRTRSSESDWIMCFKRELRFVGAGDPNKLEEILSYFLSVVNG